MLTKTAATIVASAALALLTTGCAGTGDDLCDLAAEHLLRCSGLEGQRFETCDRDRASFLLHIPCSGLEAARSTFSSSGFDPHGWLGGGGGGGQSTCMCDAECTKYGDCCASCPGGSPGGGGDTSWQSAQAGQQGASGEWTTGDCINAGIVVGLTPAVLWAMCGIFL